MEHEGAHAVVQAWHLWTTIVGVITGFIAVDRYFWAPLRKWRADMTTWRALTDEKLSAGSDRMERIEKQLTCIDGKLDKVDREVVSIATILKERAAVPPQ